MVNYVYRIHCSRVGPLLLGDLCRLSTMSDASLVNSALLDYFKTLSEQISAASRFKDAVNDLLGKCDEATKAGKGSLDEWDVLDQSYICIKLHNAFAEIDTKLKVFKSNLSQGCKQKDTREEHLKDAQNTSEEVIELVLSIVSELHQYHRTVADCIGPIVEYSAYRERYPSKYEMKECSSVPVTWKAVNEVNRSLRYGYGLSKQDLAAILSWMHGEDLSESARKTLNLKVDGLILTYKERLSKLDSCELDVPVAYQLYPLVLQDVIKDCCSPVESVAATGQTLPTLRDDLETLIRREVPRVKVQIGDTIYDVASPGKAFENTKQKMVAVRHLVTRSAKLCRIEITREQLDLFSLKVLATVCISVANASARTAVLIAFGKANLIQIRPSHSKHEPAHISVTNGSINIEVPSQWCLTEDSTLLQSLGRDYRSNIATVDTIYKCSLDLKAETQKRAQSLPVVKIVRCSGISLRKGHDKKDLSSKGLRRRLSKATSKLFNRKPVHVTHQKDAGHQEDSIIEPGKGKHGGIDNLGANIIDPEEDQNSGIELEAGRATPVPPPRPRRKARAKKKAEDVGKRQQLLEKAMTDPKWFSSCRKLGEPAHFQIEDNNACSVASFEELKDVIDLLSGSSTSSLSLNQPFEIDKNTVDKAVAKKEDGLANNTEVKGKVSPADSGIGSTMSIQRHPNVCSIVKLHGSGPVTTTATDSSTVSISENCSTEPEEEQELINNFSKNSNLLRESFLLDGEEDSRIEDAEVEMLNVNTRRQDDKVAEERDDDETPSNGNNADFFTIRPAPSDEIAPQLEQEVKATNFDINQDKDRKRSFVQSSQENSQEEDVEHQRITVDSNERQAEPLDCDVTIDQDHCSYDADGSEESIEDHETERALHDASLHDSTESLYYSTWTLDEQTDAPSKKEVVATDNTVDSYFVSSVIDSCLSDSANDTLEDFQDCRESDTMLHQQLNPRFSWPVGLGDRLAAIWGEQELQYSQGSASNVIWSSVESSSSDKNSDRQTMAEGSPSYAARGKALASLNRSRQWLPQRQIADESFQNIPSKQDGYWTGQLSVSNRHKEERQPSDWTTAMSRTRQHDRGGQVSSAFQQVSVSNLNSRPQSQFSAAQGWSSSAATHQWGQSFPRFHGANLSRPSSVPGMGNTPHTDQSRMGIGHHSMETFDAQNVDSLECNPQSPAFQFPTSNSKSATSRFIDPQYQPWNRDVSSEPLLTATTKRSIAEYEALYMQQQRQQARHSSRNAALQFSRSQKW